MNNKASDTQLCRGDLRMIYVLEHLVAPQTAINFFRGASLYIHPVLRHSGDSLTRSRPQSLLQSLRLYFAIISD
jgi:hypothetical protein